MSHLDHPTSRPAFDVMREAGRAQIRSEMLASARDELERGVSHAAMIDSGYVDFPDLEAEADAADPIEPEKLAGPALVRSENPDIFSNATIHPFPGGAYRNALPTYTKNRKTILGRGES